MKISYAHLYFVTCIGLLSCTAGDTQNTDEHIRVDEQADHPFDSSSSNVVKGNLSFSQVKTTPGNVILTGMQAHRLVPLYKSMDHVIVKREYDSFYGSKRYDESDEYETHFMPGVDLLHGYNLLNVAHYDLTTGKLNLMFDHAALVKSLYYPSFVQDSIDKKPVNRDYYLVSVYDSDTNGDTLISKQDLRHFYYLNADASNRIQLVPADYSVLRSQYDPANDVMYVFARHDSNKNGKSEKEEPIHIFWFSLRAPEVAKRMWGQP